MIERKIMYTDTPPDTRGDHPCEEIQKQQENDRARRRRKIESFMIRARSEQSEKERQQEAENQRRELQAWDETIANIRQMNHEFDR